MGEVVRAGRVNDVRELHRAAIKEACVRRTILSLDYQEFGLGISRSPCGDLVLVVLFRG